MQKESNRRSASGKWLEGEERLEDVVMRQYKELEEPDESDQVAFDLYFAVGMLLAQGKPHDAGATLNDLLDHLKDAAQKAPRHEPKNWNTAESIAQTSTSREQDRLASITSGKTLGPLEDDEDLAELAQLVDLPALLKRKVLKIEGYDDMNAGPMGEAVPRYAGCTFPTVEIDFIGPGQFGIKPTQAVHVANHLWKLVPIGTHSLGVIVSVTGDLVTTASEQSRMIKGASADWKGCQLFRGVNAETYREIQKRELEHLVDFAYAFTLATQPIVDAVQKVAGQVFDHVDKPLLAVIALLSGEHRCLVPKHPRSPWAWRDRCTFVAQQLAELSTARDDKNNGTHRPIGYVANKVGSEVIILPKFKPGRLATPQIIVMSGIGTVFQQLKVHVDIPAPKTRCMVFAEMATMAYEVGSGRPLARAFLDAFGEVTIVRQVSGDSMLVSVAAKVVGVTLDDPNALVWLEVPIDDLTPV